MKRPSFEKYMKAQSAFLQKKAERENISIIDAIKKYSEYFRDTYAKRFEKIEIINGHTK